MQEFNTRQARHRFKIDGRWYWMPGLTIGDLAVAGALQDMDPTDRVPAFAAFIRSHVRRESRVLPRLRGRFAARRLGIPQINELWLGWVGVPGEARSSSSGSPESTAASSPATSAPSTGAPSTVSPVTNSPS